MRFLLLSLTLTLLAQAAYAQGLLENPAPNSNQSGISTISGWHCNATRIEIQVDDRPPSPAGYGTSRGDTEGICGDRNNGFALLTNWNLFGEGVHTVRAFADGVEFGNATVTVTTFGPQFLQGESAQCRVSQFPDDELDTILTWQESLQNFVIADTVPTEGGLPNYDGTWHGGMEALIDIARSDVFCSDAPLTIEIRDGEFSGSFVNEDDIFLTYTGVVGSEGVVGILVRRDGEHFAVGSGLADGNRIIGRWTDVFGCWGDFELERE